MTDDFAEELTQSKIKQYLEDKNGGTAFIFCAIFRSIEDVKKDIRKLEQLMEPVATKYNKEKTILSFFNSVKGKCIGVISLVLLLVSFAGAIQKIVEWWIK